MAVNEYDDILSGEAVGVPAPQEPVVQDTVDYDQLIQEDKNTQKQVLRQNLVVAGRQDSQKKSRALELSNKLSVPVAVVERNLDAFEQQNVQHGRD